MENFKNTLSVGAEKIAEEIQVSNQKEMSEVFNFIYSGASPQEIYEWLEDASDSHYHEMDIINAHMSGLKDKKTEELKRIFCYFSDLAEDHINIWVHIRPIDMEP